MLTRTQQSPPLWAALVAPFSRRRTHALAEVFALALTCFVSAPATAQDLAINEVMSSNGSSIVDEDGESPDWVEIFNRGSSAIDLESYGLSDDADPLQWKFPSLLISPGGHLLVFCSGKDRTNAPAHWETVIADGDNWKYLVPTSEPSAAWRRPGFNDASWAAGATGIGYGDGDDRTEVPAGTVSVYARKAFQVEDPTAISKVFLDIDFDDAFVAFLNGTEIARENITDQGRPPIYTEVADASTEPRLATGGKLFHYGIESFSSLLRAGENVLAIQVHNIGAGSSDLSLIPYLTLGMNRLPANARGPADILKPTLPSLHTSFKISTSGETITLAAPDGTVLDAVDPGALPTDVSKGRFPDGSADFAFYSPATPGAPNASGGFVSIGGSVAFSQQGGFYPGPINIALATDEPVGAIFVTTDGSVPTEASAAYAGPLQIQKTTVVRARVLGGGILPGATTTQTFVVGRKPALPVVSISTDPANFFDSTIGIYVNGDSFDASFPYFGSNFWEDWERPVHLELYELDGALGFSQDAGAKIFGGWSRGNPQRSLAFFARSQYGASKFSYRIFPEKGIKSFESFILRNSGNDWQITHFRDAMMTSLVKDLGIDRLAYRPSAIFINGEYWGILNLREKINEHFLAANHRGVRADQIDLLEADGSPIHGDADHYRAMLALLQGSDISDPAVYAQVDGMVDMENFIDYQAAQIYFDNTDWPGNNIKFWRPRVEGGRWRWILYDTDFGFGIWNGNNYLNNTLAFALTDNGPSWPNPPWSTFMLRTLVTNRTFLEDFVNRFATHLNTIYVPAKVVARIDSMARGIESEMPSQRNRWGSDMNAWRSSVQVLRDFANRRVPQMRSHLASTLGLGATATLRLSLASPVGGVIEIQGIPIRNYPFTGAYFQGLPIRLTARPDPGFRFVGWTGIEPADQADASVVLERAGLSLTASFELDCASVSDVVINEIQYNSPADADTGDWVEIYNRTGATLDLAGWTFRDAAAEHVFTFPAGAQISGDGYLVLCSSIADFSRAHPTIDSTLGDIGFSLAGQGESIGLFDASGREVDRVAYDDFEPWPVEADGGGATLALKNPLLHGSYALHWTASSSGGTPGARNDVFVAVDAVCVPGETQIVRGDCDADGAVTIADPIRLLFASFGGASMPCRSACDANGDGSTGGVSDAIHLLRYLFLQGPSPVPPFPSCGAPILATDAGLGCETASRACR